MLGLGGLLAMATKQSRNRETRRANFVLRCATNAEGGWMLVLVLACGQTLPWHGGDGSRGRARRDGLVSSGPPALFDWVASRLVSSGRGLGARGYDAVVGPQLVCVRARLVWLSRDRRGVVMVGTPSGTVTLLFTDIEGSTALWESHPEEMRVALERHDELLRGAIESSGGHVFKTVGDAFCAVFEAAGSALAAAVAVQRAIAAEPWPEPLSLRVRIGVHSGMCSERDGDYFGPTVNRAARVQALAHGGQLLLSGAAGELAAEELPEGVALRDMGEHRLKHLERPERVFQVDIDGLPMDFPPLRSFGGDAAGVSARPGRPLTSFVGRADELAKVQELLARNRLLTLTGPGGSGKTRLAVEVARDLAGRFQGGSHLSLIHI